jgi:hypothetical protein
MKILALLSLLIPISGLCTEYYVGGSTGLTGGNASFNTITTVYSVEQVCLNQVGNDCLDFTGFLSSDDVVVKNKENITEVGLRVFAGFNKETGFDPLLVGLQVGSTRLGDVAGFTTSAVDVTGVATYRFPNPVGLKIRGGTAYWTSDGRDMDFTYAVGLDFYLDQLDVGIEAQRFTGISNTDGINYVSLNLTRRW